MANAQGNIVSRALRAIGFSKANPAPARRRQRLRLAPVSGMQGRAFNKLGLNMPPMPSVFGGAGISVKPNELLDRFVSHPGAGISPQQVIQIYRSAEQGYPQAQFDLFNDTIEGDGHLRSAIEDRMLSVCGKDWRVMPGGEDQQDILAADLLQGMLEQTNFNEVIAKLLASRYFGFSASEIDWRRIDGDVVPNWFVTVPFRRFRFDKDDQPLLLSLNSWEGSPLEPGKWVTASNAGPIFDVVPRSGLMRTATWYSLFKRWSWRDWVIYCEKFGIPLVIGKHEPGATEDEIEQIEQTVQDIGDAGQATMSTNMEIDIREAQRSGDSAGLHRAIVGEANQEMSKLITGSTLTGQSGGPGSFALGKVHEGRAFNLVIADASMVNDRFQATIARPFLEYNGLKLARLPKLKIYIERETDPLRRMTLAKGCHDLGMTLDVEQIRAETGFRAPPNEARTLYPVKGAESTDDKSDDDDGEEREAE